MTTPRFITIYIAYAFALIALMVGCSSLKYSRDDMTSYECKDEFNYRMSRVKKQVEVCSESLVPIDAKARAVKFEQCTLHAIQDQCRYLGDQK